MGSEVDGRVPYMELTSNERDAIHEWLELHGVRLAGTPTDPMIEYDRATNEWRIEQYARRDGHVRLGDDGEPARVAIRRAWKAWLPWPTDPARTASQPLPTGLDVHDGGDGRA